MIWSRVVAEHMRGGSKKRQRDARIVSVSEKLDSVSFSFLFICFYLQFIQFRHLVEFFNSYINMLVATSSGVPSSRLLGYILCEVCWVFPF